MPVFFPLRLSLNPSRRLANLVFAIHGVTALSFLGSSLSLGLRIAGFAVLAASLVQAQRRVGRPWAKQLTLEESGQLHCGVGGEGGERGEPCTMLGSCRDLGWAVWLSWREEGGPSRHLMLLPDMLEDRESWRLLRIWLRHKALKASSAGADSLDPG